MINISDELKKKYQGDLLPPDISLKIGDVTYSNSDFISGSLKIKETLCSKETLDYTSVEASSVKLTLAKESGNVFGLVGKRVIIKQSELSLGVYTIHEAKLSTDYTTDIECYDDIKKFIDKDVSDWWNKQLQFPITIKNLLISLCAHVGVQTALPEEWINSDMQVNKTAYMQNIKGSEILGYIQEASGSFFRMNRDGKLKIVTPTKEPKQIPYTSLIEDPTISDLETKPIEKLAIKSTENDIGVYSGLENGNTYLILANPLFLGFSSDDLKAMVDKLFPLYKGWSYKPCKAQFKSLPYLEVGDWLKVKTYKGIEATFPILSRELSDMNLLLDTVETKGSKEQKKTVSATKKISILERNSHEFENTLEKFRSEIETISTGLDNVTQSSKSSIEQLNNSITQLVSKTSKNDDEISELKTFRVQTEKRFSETVTKKEYDGTIAEIQKNFDDKGLHIKRKINGQESKKEALLNDDELRFTRADGTDAVRINEHESYFGKWVTIASHRLEVFPIHEWDSESVGGINRDSQTISGTGLFYSGDSEGV